MNVISIFGVLFVLVLTASSTGGQDRSTRTDFVRFEFETPGGPLPFVLRNERMMYASNPPSNAWSVLNGDEAIWVQNVANLHEQDPELASFQNVISISEFGAAVWWSIGNDRGEGVYRKDRGGSSATIPLTTRYVEHAHDRFDREHPLDPTAITAINGRWVVDFASSDDEALGVFEVQPDGYAAGTYLTPTGDYRFLEGVVDGRTLKLSCFDGGHAFLFHATLTDDGDLAGDFWSGDWWHETWTATPAPEGYELPDAFALTEWTGEAGLDELVFTDLKGNEKSVAQAIEEGGGGPAIIEVFGSWCPNCHDAAAAVRDLSRKTGITVVGLAFELTDDFERSKRQVQTFMRKHGIDHPVLIAGVADKGEASKALPALDKLRAYPTTIFVRADGTIAAVHTGFTGPAAPEEHRALIERFESIVRGMQGGSD